MSGPGSNTHTVVAGTRRSWTREEKRAIVEEAQQAPCVSAIARRHGLTSSLLFRWRREFWDEERAGCAPPQPAFVPLALPASTLAVAQREERPRAGMIEIELAGGHRVRAEAGVDLALLQGAIAALTRG